MAHVDRISHLPEELLLRILSLLPTKDVVVTMVLSKRWKFLWMLVPRLEYDHAMNQDVEGRRFSQFVYSSLLLHKAPVLESLLLKLDSNSSAIEIGVWVRTAIKRRVRELDIDINIDSDSVLTPVILPWSLYSAGCKMLVTLKLSNMTLVDASKKFSASFPSLKKLSLVYMKYPSEDFVFEFLCSCSVLEDLVVERCPDDNVTTLAVNIPSLKSLSLGKSNDVDEDKTAGFFVEAPLLESLDILDHNSGYCYISSNMPEIVNANLDINYCILWNVLGFITSVKRLYLCSTTFKNAYPDGSVFHRLVHLTLCTCGKKWLKLLVCLLRDSPKLQVLKFEQCHDIVAEVPRPLWNEPSSVPECVLSSIETLEWVKHEGREEEKEVVAYIFRNARCLKKANISSTSTDPVKKLELLKELTFLSRCSSICHLTFD